MYVPYVYLFFFMYVALTFSMQHIKNISISTHIYLLIFLMLHNAPYKFKVSMFTFLHVVHKLFYGKYFPNKYMFWIVQILLRAWAQSLFRELGFYKPLAG